MSKRIVSNCLAKIKRQIWLCGDMLEKDRKSFIKKNQLCLLFIIILLMYTSFAFIRPYEDDESLYIRAGKAIINNDLNPFNVVYYKHYLNPFQYIMGSPLVPLIFGVAYNMGGIIFVRLVAMVFVVLSLFLVYKMIIKAGGGATLPVLLIAFSSSTIVLASAGLLDSVSLFFLMFALYLLYTDRLVYAGLFSGLAMTSKFILVIPIIMILVYQIFKKKWLGYLAGLLLMIIPFIVLYRELMPILVNFILVAKVDATSVGKLGIFLRTFFLSLPIVSIFTVFYLKSKLKDLRLFFIPVISILLVQIFLMDYSSLVRHLPYAEFSGAVVFSIIVSNKKRWVWLFLLLYVIASVGFAINDVYNYPSYALIKDDLNVVNGRVLAINLNSFMLIKDMPLNSTAENVFGYYYFNYDGVVDSKIEEYEHALKDGYFDYALISSYSPQKFPRYKLIEDLVREHYCPLHNSKRPGGIDIYKRCD